MNWTRESWAVEALRRACDRIRSAPEGDRNWTLFQAAERIGAYVADGALADAVAVAELAAAAESAGLGSKETSGTISSGMGRATAEQAWYPSRSPTWGGRVRTSSGRTVVSDEALGAVPLPTAPLPEDATVRVTLYPRLTHTQGTVRRLGWEKLATMAAEPRAWPDTGKKGLPLLSLAEIEDDDRRRRMGDDGKEREPETRALHGIVLDYDDEPEWSVDTVRRWWGAVTFVAHSSANHLLDKDGRTGPRGRVILAVSRAMTPDEYLRIAEWVLHCGRGRVGEPELKTTRRAFFVPASAPGGYAHASSLNGQALDVDSLLASLRDLEEDSIASEVDSGPHPETWERLQIRKDRKTGAETVLASIPNAVVILTHDPRWRGRLRENVFAGRVELDGAPLTDAAEVRLICDIARVYGCNLSPATLHSAAIAVAAEHPTHPVREYLEALRWDGTPRLDRWLADFCGCEDDELSELYGLKWAIGAVARIFRPGCKVDTMLVLQSDLQGQGKSTAVRVMSDPWFSDSAVHIGDKDGYQSLRGVWVVEFAELDSMRRGEVTAVRTFLSASIDKYRPSYGRNVIEVRRECVFAGTTNELQFLMDPAGDRRFWVRRVVGPIDVPALRAVRDQLWAEAVHRYRAGEQWWLDGFQDEARDSASEAHRVRDPWEQPIAEWLDSKLTGSVSVLDVLTGALKMREHDTGRPQAMRVATILKGLGWGVSKERHNGRPQQRWRKRGS
jgi:predicted P-loop ATPase